MTQEKLALIMGVCILAAALCRLFDSTAKEYSVLVKTAAAIGITYAVVSAVIPITERIEALYETTSGSGAYLTLMFKGLGICYLTQLASDICRDSGEGTLAVQAETAGKAALLMISMPLFEKAAQLAIEMIY